MRGAHNNTLTLWPVRHHDGPSIKLSFRDLPRKIEVLFLQGR